MKINEAGVDLIKEFEGCKLEAYKCPAGVWTIGYGQTGKNVHQGMKIDQATADLMLMNALELFDHGVECLLNIEISDNQFSALVCFAYNCGLAALGRSRLLEYVNKGEFAAASDQFARWNKAGGQESKGLTRRRAAETSLFRS